MQLHIPWPILAGISVAFGDALEGVYNSSLTPSSLPWNTYNYNYCNAPHVNGNHYFLPVEAQGAKLVYLNTVMRHHKRTPDNLYPQESALNSVTWDCADLTQYNFGGGTAQIFHETNVPSWHPFLREFWNGTCDLGQLTRGGLDDAITHGRDFFSVYDKKLGFLADIDEKDIIIRTSTEQRTFQVAGGFLFGADASMAKKSFPVVTQPSHIDSIPPSYSCPRANKIRNAYQSVPAWTQHLEENAPLKERLDKTLGTEGLQAWASWWSWNAQMIIFSIPSRLEHVMDIHCHATLPGHVSLNRTLRRFTDSYIWNAAENSTEYNQLTFGVFMAELLQNFQGLRAGHETYKMRLYVGHDGTMIRLASLLGFGQKEALRWPALGSEIILEVWQMPDDELFIRALHEGTVKQGYEWVPIDAFIQLLESQIVDDLYQACNQ